ncbi:Uncharacterised protein [Vibrio cholerae]|nr:Uncharacterised protein [Vibrio cholerae]CSC51227.1 Uncharacterised protein [Vibrio cholerae]CSI52961.1 Uncharacterised protein [Vibrio cholerae]
MVGGEQGKVGVNARRTFVEVAGTNVRVTNEFIPFFTGNKQELGVNLHSRHTENNVYARIGQNA